MVCGFFIYGYRGLVLFSNSQMFASWRKIRQVITPKIPSRKRKKAAPEPFPVPNKVVRIEPKVCCAIKGSNILSIQKPPRTYPNGIVKNCNVFLAAYTRPCIGNGI